MIKAAAILLSSTAPSVPLAERIASPLVSVEVSDHQLVENGCEVMKAGDKASYSRYIGLDGLEIMSARWMDHAFAPHMHDFYAVSLNYAGHGTFDCAGAARSAEPGACSLISPGVVHTGRATCADGWAYRNLHIEQDLMTTLLRGCGWRGPESVTFKEPSVRDPVLARGLAAVFASVSSLSLLRTESELLFVVARLITVHLTSGHALDMVKREQGAVARVRAWLEAHPEQNVSTGTLAGIAGISPFHMVRAFRNELGVPPHRYQMVVRVNRARRLLRSGAAIADTAYQTGFCDQSHLNRCFKEIVGVTPGVYAAAGRRADAQHLG